jgi:serine/threonine-protein kinase
VHVSGSRCPACGAGVAGAARACPADGTLLDPDPPLAAPGAPGESTDGHTRLAGQVLADRYHVGHKVGEGGMSVVYVARDQVTGEKVAIKVLSASLGRDGNAMARLRREAELAGQLAHPNVAHIMRLGETPGGLVFVVMPFLDGELLCDRIYHERQVALRTAIRFVSDIAAGLHHAHLLGIIHRDLKPENVMLCRDAGGAERAVVMDFGLAKQRRMGREVQKLTATGIVLGTPEFMSPEQIRGKPLDPRTDIYSLGLVTCEMLTGQLPFAGETQQEIMIARLTGDPVPLGRLRPDLRFPAAVEAAVARSLDREPRARFATAPEFAAALMIPGSGGL